MKQTAHLPQAGELDGEVAKAQAVADVASLRKRLTELEGRASAGDLWDDPSHAAAVWQNFIQLPLRGFSCSLDIVRPLAQQLQPRACLTRCVVMCLVSQVGCAGNQRRCAGSAVAEGLASCAR